MLWQFWFRWQFLKHSFDLSRRGFRLSSSEIYLTVPKKLQNSFILYVLAMNDFNHMLGEEKGKSKSGATKKGEMLKKILFFFLSIIFLWGSI